MAQVICMYLLDDDLSSPYLNILETCKSIFDGMVSSSYGKSNHQKLYMNIVLVRKNTLEVA